MADSDRRTEARGLEVVRVVELVSKLARDAIVGYEKRS